MSDGWTIMHIYPLSRGLRALRSLAWFTHTHTCTELCLIRRLPSYSLCRMHKSPSCSSSFLCLPLTPSISLYIPYFGPSLSLSASLTLAVCLLVMELICLAHKECLSISAGLTVPREMVTNHTNMCICSVYIIVFVCVCV